MNNYAKRRDKQLGRSYGSCRNQLDRLILFHYIKKYKENFCYRCKREIKSINDFSIEHKIIWVDSDNPKELFWSMDNIAFSHRKCNSLSRRKWRFNGDKHWTTKISDEDVKKIRSSKLSLSKLAKKFSVSPGHIGNIKNLRKRK